MKKTTISLISGAFLFLALACFVNEHYLIAGLSFFISVGLMILMIICADNIRLSVTSLLLLAAAVVSALVFCYRSAALVPTIMSAVYATLQQYFLKGLSKRSRNLLITAGLLTTGLMTVLLIAAHIMISTAFCYEENIIVSYLPMMMLLSSGYLLAWMESSKTVPTSILAAQ